MSVHLSPGSFIKGIEKYHIASFAYTEVEYKLIPSDVIFGQDHGAEHGVDFSMVDFAMSQLVPLSCF